MGCGDDARLGLGNLEFEKWGPFGQRWLLECFSAHLAEPQCQQLIGVPLGWSPSTEVTTFVHRTANREECPRRKPLPKPQPRPESAGK